MYLQIHNLTVRAGLFKRQKLVKCRDGSKYIPGQQAELCAARETFFPRQFGTSVRIEIPLLDRSVQILNVAQVLGLQANVESSIVSLVFVVKALI